MTKNRMVLSGLPFLALQRKLEVLFCYYLTGLQRSPVDLFLALGEQQRYLSAISFKLVYK